MNFSILSLLIVVAGCSQMGVGSLGFNIKSKDEKVRQISGGWSELDSYIQQIINEGKEIDQSKVSGIVSRFYINNKDCYENAFPQLSQVDPSICENAKLLPASVKSINDSLSSVRNQLCSKDRKKYESDKMKYDYNLENLSLSEAYMAKSVVDECANKESRYQKQQMILKTMLENEKSFKSLRVSSVLRKEYDLPELSYKNMKQNLDEHIKDLEKNKVKLAQAVELRKKNNIKNPKKFETCKKIRSTAKDLGKKLEESFAHLQEAPHNKELQKKFLSFQTPMEKVEAQLIQNSCYEFNYED